MDNKDTKAASLVRYGGLDDMPVAPPLSQAVKAMSDAEIDRLASEDADAGAVPADFWAKAQSKLRCDWARHQARAAKRSFVDATTKMVG
jgi:hypothetical protein